MELILLKEVEKLGDINDVVTVKSGYGRNFLIPQGLAVIANKSNLKSLKERVRQHDAREAKMLGTYQEIADKLKEAVIKIGAKAGTSGKIFGSVTNLQLADAIKEQIDLEIDRKKIVLLEDVKELGVYSATVSLHKEVEGKITFEVIAD